MEIRRRRSKPEGTCMECEVRCKLKRETYDALYAYCNKEEMNLSEFLRQAVRKLMKELKLIE